MSHYFEMQFTPCEPENVLDKCLEVVKLVVNDAGNIIRENICYAPTHKFELKGIEEWIINSNWLYSLFNFRFVYWKEKKLLGLLGGWSGKADNLFTNHIAFQNSTDQDYDYSKWNGIPCFEDVIYEVESMDIKTLQHYNEDLTEEEIISKESYIRRWLVYSKIYEMLDLDKWLYGEEGNFQRIAMSGIDSSETLENLYRKMCRYTRR